MMLCCIMNWTINAPKVVGFFPQPTQSIKQDSAIWQRKCLSQAALYEPMQMFFHVRHFTIRKTFIDFYERHNQIFLTNWCPRWTLHLAYHSPPLPPLPSASEAGGKIRQKKALGLQIASNNNQVQTTGPGGYIFHAASPISLSLTDQQNSSTYKLCIFLKDTFGKLAQIERLAKFMTLAETLKQEFTGKCNTKFLSSNSAHCDCIFLNLLPTMVWSFAFNRFEILNHQPWRNRDK